MQEVPTIAKNSEMVSTVNIHDLRSFSPIFDEGSLSSSNASQDHEIQLAVNELNKVRFSDSNYDSHQTGAILLEYDQSSSSPHNSLNNRNEPSPEFTMFTKIPYTDWQRDELEREFQIDKSSRRSRPIQIGQKLQLSEKEVRLWFKNRRRKYWKDMRKNLVSSSESSDSPNSTGVSDQQSSPFINTSSVSIIKRGRTSFTRSQLDELESQFHADKYLSFCRPCRIQIGQRLGLSDAQIRVWFINKRRRYKDEKRKNKFHLSTISDSSDSINNSSSVIGVSTRSEDVNSNQLAMISSPSSRKVKHRKCAEKQRCSNTDAPPPLAAELVFSITDDGNYLVSEMRKL